MMSYEGIVYERAMLNSRPTVVTKRGRWTLLPRWMRCSGEWGVFFTQRDGTRFLVPNAPTWIRKALRAQETEYNRRTAR